MNQIELVKRAWQITWRYKVLWIFGILLALTGAGGGGGGGGNGGLRVGDRGFEGGVPGIPGLQGVDWGAVLTVLIVCCCLLVILAIVGLIVNYVARAALYRMVDQIEESGMAPTWREGFRLGWTGRTLRLFLLDLIVGIPLVLLVFLLLALAASPLLLLLVQSDFANVLAIVATIVLLLGFILLLIVIAAVVGVLGQFWSREVILADRSVGQALVSGFELVRNRILDVGGMWLLLLAIGLGFGLLLIPVAIVVVFAAIAVGGGVGYAIYAASNSVVLAALVGVPLALLIIVPILSILQGIYLVFDSSAWTLAYRSVTGAQGQPDRSVT